MPARSHLSSLVFSSLGHLYIHFFTAFYFVIVLAIEIDWQIEYHRLIELWTIGAALVGAAALPAGWLADRYSSSAMMVVFFIGLGSSSIAAGLAAAPFAMMLSLCALGLFAAIYHPVGIPWLIRNAAVETRGRALAINGVFGNLGAAVAGLIAGALIDLAGWRAAFILPGVICAATGVALWRRIRTGEVGDRRSAETMEHAPSRAEMMRVFAILLFSMFLAGIIFHTTQTALPKLFAVRQRDLIGDSAFGVGILVAVVYGTAAVMQLGGGYLADRYPLKPIYIGAFVIQAPLLWLAATLAGVPLVIVAALMVMAAVAALPAENMLLARYAPRGRHGLVFGIKFVIAFGTAPLSVLLVASITERTASFYWVFTTLAILAAAVMLAAWMLPGRPRAESARAPAA